MNTDNLRYPVLGASFQPRGGVARHDAIAWGFAMRADEMGVDIIQNCEAKQIRTKNGKIEGVETSKGFIRALIKPFDVSTPSIFPFLVLICFASQF